MSDTNDDNPTQKLKKEQKKTVLHSNAEFVNRPIHRRTGLAGPFVVLRDGYDDIRLPGHSQSLRSLSYSRLTIWEGGVVAAP
jgi:hypothetical protein